MSVATIILLALAISVAVAGVIVLIYLNRNKLKELLTEHLQRKKKSKVAFGSTHKIVNEHAKEILAQAPSMTMAELEQVADDSPYFIADYDQESGEMEDFTIIQAENVEDKVEEVFDENDGIVLFD